jgi:hypothetical protein
VNKSVTLSVRLPDDDAAFVAGLEIEGAATPSDKLRAIIREARLRTEMSRSFAEAHDQLQSLLRPSVQALRMAEHDSGLHSEVLERCLPWLTEIAAFILSSPLDVSKSSQDLIRLEDGVAVRIFRLFEFALRLAATPSAPGYDKAVMERQLAGIKDLLELVLKRLEDKAHG